MKNSTSYKKAVASISTYMDHHPKKINAFEASLILVYMFDAPKEKTFDDLIHHREKKAI